VARGVLASFILVIALVFSVSASAADYGVLAAKEMRIMAAQFKGRMAGTAQEDAAAGYLAGRFREMGYKTSVLPFKHAYEFKKSDGSTGTRDLFSRNVVAVKPGAWDKTVIVGAHFDTYAPLSEGEIGGPGGPDLEGLDDNASGVGMLLELADRLKDVQTADTVVFIAFGAEETGSLGAKSYIERMTMVDCWKAVVMINIDGLITGDKIYFHAGRNTTAREPKAGFARDRALAIAEKLGIAAETNPGLNVKYPKGTGCCSDAVPFDMAGVPVLEVEASNWDIGDRSGRKQTDDPALKDGISWHLPGVDNPWNLERVLPGRIERRARDFSRILTPLVIELADGVY